jgi:hypothetical protein
VPSEVVDVELSGGAWALHGEGLEEDDGRPGVANSGATRLSQPIVRMAAASRMFCPRRECIRLLVMSFIASSAAARTDCIKLESGCNIWRRLICAKRSSACE